MNAKFVTISSHWLAQQLATQQQHTRVGGESEYMCALGKWRYKRVIAALLSEVYPASVYSTRYHWTHGSGSRIGMIRRKFLTDFCDLAREDIASSELRLDFISRLLIRPDRLLVVPVTEEGVPA